MKRSIGILLALVMAAGCTRVGTGGGAGGRANATTIPHTLRYATAEDLVGLNPLLNTQGTLQYMSSLVMAWLIKWDRNNRPLPELATVVPTKANGGISADGKTITYHLRKGVVWSDGAPFNADDVVFTEKQVLNPANNVVSTQGWDLITKLDEPDKYTVIFHLKKPYAPFLPTFFSSAGANPCVLPKHILNGLPNINKAPYNSLPVGIGPFKYAEWQRGDHVTLVPNPRYFRGLPKLQKIIFKLIPSRDTVFAELQSGELDLWYPVPGLYMSRFGELGSGVAKLVQPSYFYNHIDFNVQSPKLQELAVRQALRYATDRRTMWQKVDHRSGVLQESPLAEAAPYHVPNIPFNEYDLAKANALLDGAGWKRGPDGIRRKNGVELVLDVATSTGSQDADEKIEIMRSSWKQIGVGMNVQHYLSSLLFAPYQDHGIIYSGKFDVVFFAWQLDPIGDMSILYACDQIPPNGQNDSRWCNREATDAMYQARVLYSFEERQPYEDKVIDLLVHDVPTIVMKVNDDNFIFNKDLKNFHPNQVSQFDDFMNVDI